MSKELKIIKDLKQRNDRLNNQYMQEQARNYHLNCVVDKYKLILNEIREYIDEFIIYSDVDGEIYFKEEFRTEYNDLLKILDKVEDLC